MKFDLPYPRPGQLRFAGTPALVFSLLGLTCFVACGDDANTDATASTTASSTSSGQGGKGGSGGTGGNSSSAGGTGGNSNSAGGTGGTSQGGGAASMVGNTNCADSMGTAGKLTATEIASGFNKPVLVTSAWGDSDRLYVVEQRGTIQVLVNGQKSQFLDITSKVINSGERGLLGLAFHPQYVQNGRFFVHYSQKGTNAGIVEEYQRDSTDPNKASNTAVGLVLDAIDQPASNHNGGSIEFNPTDGYLYIGLGDGGGANDTFGNGQNKNSLLGTLLRLDVSSLPGTAPPGNLSGGKPEIFDWGLRNPFRFSFDPCTGARYIADVGQNKYEEVDIAAATLGPQNWGWNIAEANHCFNSQNCDMTGLAPAAAEYDHSKGASITGGVVYRGSKIPWLRGAYFYGDYTSGRVWTLRWKDGIVIEQPVEVQSEIDLPSYGITSFGYDNNGEVYISHHGGKVYRIDPSN